MRSGPQFVDGLGLYFPGRGLPPPKTPCLVGVPPYPTTEAIRPAVVPPPPLLDPDASDEELAFECLRAYRGAVAAVTKKPCHVLVGYTPVKLRRWGGYSRLVEGAQLLLSYGVPPAAWVMFSIQTWRQYVMPSLAGKRASMPPLSWVYQVTRLADHLDHFAEDSDFSGGRVVVGPAMRALIYRYEGMGYQLRRESRTPDDARRIVEKWFPAGVYQDMVAAARVEGERERKRLQAALERGEWIWS